MATIQMNFIANSPHAPAIIIPVLAAVAVFLASGFVTATMIVETRVTNHKRSAAIIRAMLSRGSSVTRHVTAFLNCGSVTGTRIVTMGQTNHWMFAKVNKSRKILASIAQRVDKSTG